MSLPIFRRKFFILLFTSNALLVFLFLYQLFAGAELTRADWIICAINGTAALFCLHILRKPGERPKES